MKKIKLSKIALLALLGVISISQINAADLKATSSIPTVVFIDTDHHATNAAFKLKASLFAGDTYLSFYDHVYGGTLFEINNDVNDIGTKAFISNSSGDINLANGSVWIDKSENNVGIGTAAPDAGLHIVNTKTIIPPAPSFYTSARATLKLETKDGFDWSLISNWNRISTIPPSTPRKTFYIKDDTAGTYPFGIKGGAPSSSMYIQSSGNVGIGTSGPSTKLHVYKTISSSAKVVTELLALSLNNTDTSGFSDTGFKLENKKEAVEWTFRTLEEDTLMGSTRNGFAISKKDSGKKEMILTGYDSAGGMKLILGNGAKNSGGTWVNASSRSLKENIKTLDTAAALKAFSKLQPVTYNYKTDKGEQFVGFIAEDVPELVAMNSRDGLSAMDMVAVLTKVVQEQDKMMTETRAELKATQEKITKLETMQNRLAKVESLLTNLALDTSSSQSEKVSLNLK